MTYNKNYKSKDTDERETPPELFNIIDKEFQFKMDAAASRLNTKCDTYIDQDRDALYTEWKYGPIWCNPPWSRGFLPEFTKHAVVQAAAHQQNVVLLVPADPSTGWWKNTLSRTRKWKVPFEIRFLIPRVKFWKDGEPMQGGDMRPSALFIFRCENWSPPEQDEIPAIRIIRFWNWQTGEYI